LERSRNLIFLLKATVHPAPRNDSVLGPLLEMCDSAMTYRRRYHARAQLAPVLDLLIADEINPRSLTWQLNQLTRHASKLPRDGREGNQGEEKRQVDAMLSLLAGANFSKIASDEDTNPGGMLTLCTELEGRVINLSETITQHYFNHALPLAR
jgi:uncharacterized alpha-E superfamily protein